MTTLHKAIGQRFGATGVHHHDKDGVALKVPNRWNTEAFSRSLALLPNKTRSLFPTKKIWVFVDVSVEVEGP